MFSFSARSRLEPDRPDDIVPRTDEVNLKACPPRRPAHAPAGPGVFQCPKIRSLFKDPFSNGFTVKPLYSQGGGLALQAGEGVFETFSPKLISRINAAKYEAVPILKYLQDLNARIKANGGQS